MVNIDMDETQDLYESCITYNDPDRIVDTTTTTLNDGQERNTIEETIKTKLCETQPSASPTRPDCGTTFNLDIIFMVDVGCGSIH